MIVDDLQIIDRAVLFEDFSNVTLLGAKAQTEDAQTTTPTRAILI